KMFLSFLDNSKGLLGRRIRNQFLVTLMANSIIFCHGLGIGWMSPVMKDLPSGDSPLSFNVYVEDISWIGSLVGIGAMIGNILAGTLIDRIGRKPIMFGIAFPYMTFWFLVYFVERVEYLYVGRLLAGLTNGAGYIVLPTFISEIADDNIRGRLGSLILLFVNAGVLTGYIVSSNFNYFTTPPYILALPVLYIIMNLFIPETPHHLIRKGKFDLAKNSFNFYKNIRRDDVKAESEFEDLKDKVLRLEAEKNKSIDYRDFVTKPAFRAYISALVLIIGNQFSGSFCFSSYLSTIFAESHTTLDLTMCTIIIGFLQIVGTYVTSLLCDKYGRRILLLVSASGSSCCLLAFGCFTYFARRHDLSSVGWLPLLIISCYVFLCNIGLVGCLFVVLVELFPAKIRSVGVFAFIVILSGFVFLALKIFPLCLASWGISVTMWCCSGTTFLTFLYFTFFLEETKGKSLLET
ncbi:hypothetical protein KR018_005249, partial [Drosophila ironensis]